MQKEKISKDLMLAERAISGARHILKVIMPISGDSKLILKSFEKTYESLVLTISFILKYEHLNKKIRLSKEKSENIEIFFSKCSSKYSLNEADNLLIRDILTYWKKHKEANVEFSRRNKVVMMNDKLETIELHKERLEKYILLVEELLKNVYIQISN